jgi:hypothetical protein
VVSNICETSAAHLLAEAHAAGLSVVSECGRLVVRGPKNAADVAQRLIARKAEVLPLVPVWDQAEADRLLSEARGAVSRAEAARQAGRMSAARRNVVALWLDVCEGFAWDRGREALAGWDAMDLLRAAARHAVEKAAEPTG